MSMDAARCRLPGNQQMPGNAEFRGSKSRGRLDRTQGLSTELSTISSTFDRARGWRASRLLVRLGGCASETLYSRSGQAGYGRSFGWTEATK